LMDKAVRTSLWKQLTDALLEAFPSLEPNKQKSVYVWPGELVCRSRQLASSRTAFVIISPSQKGREQFTVELAWSMNDQFPPLTQRPSGVSHQNESLLSQPQAAVRLFTLANPNASDWVEVGKDTIGDAVERTVRELKQYGLPYLSRVGKS
jgi:hypothetical protein